MSVEDLLEPTDTLGMYRGILSNEMNCDKVDTLEWSIAITSRLLLRRRNGRNARRPVLEQKLRRLLGRWRAGAGVALGFAAWRRDAARRRVDRLAAAFGRLRPRVALTSPRVRHQELSRSALLFASPEAFRWRADESR